MCDSCCCKGLRDAVNFSTAQNANDFVTFQWCNNRWLFALYRFVVAVYFSVWVVLCVLWEDKYVIYLTYWTLSIFTGYLIVSAILCIILSASPSLSGNILIRFLLSLTWLAYYIVASLNPIIVVIFWTLIYNSSTQTILIQNLSIHFLNGVFIAFNLLVSAQPHQWLHVWIPMLYASLYFIFMGIWYKEGGVNENGEPYVYSDLNFSTEPVTSTLLILAVIFIAIPVVHTIIWAITKLRQLVYKKCCCCCHGNRVTQVSPEPPQMVQRISVGSINDKNLPPQEIEMMPSVPEEV